MTKECYFLPMPHRVALLVYSGFEPLDVAGPASVFSAANYALRQQGQKAFYTVEVVSLAGGLVEGDGGIAIHTRTLARVPPSAVDTLLIVGGHIEYLSRATVNLQLRRWIGRCAKSATRIGSICSGAFTLARLGILDGKRAVTHWEGCALLSEMHPSVQVDSDALYVVDGNVWTSAGVTAGIDMALAMVSRDVGADIASQVAKGLVLYARRPGYQSQFSTLLRAQLQSDNPFAELIDWMQANLDRALDVPSLAARANLSERSFYRKFFAATSQSPARFVEAIRLEAARMLLSRGLSSKDVAVKVGLSPTSRLTEAFERRVGMTPRLFREMHASID